jgi:hypothetical protein
MYRRRYAMLDVAGDRLELRLLQIRKAARHGRAAISCVPGTTD